MGHEDANRAAGEPGPTADRCRAGGGPGTGRAGGDHRQPSDARTGAGRQPETPGPADAGPRPNTPARPRSDEDEPAETFGYEQARDELVSVVKRLEAGGLTLEQSLQLWERGEQLAAVCAELLAGARARLTTAIAERAPADQTDPDAPF